MGAYSGMSVPYRGGCRRFVPGESGDNGEKTEVGEVGDGGKEELEAFGGVLCSSNVRSEDADMDSGSS